MEKIKNLFKTTGTKQGTYSVGITAIVLAIIVVANLIVGQLPEKYRNIDVSSTNIYEISETSRKLLKELDQDVTLTVLAVKENADERIKTFLSKYASLSDHITVEWIDPVLHPSALSEYEAAENTIVVTGEETGKTTQISFGDIIVSDMYSYYYTGTASEMEFDGEGQLTSAVNYVTGDVSKKIYRTAGHGEATLSATVTDLMDKNNYTLSELNLLMNPEIPEDCDLLLMYAPAKDLTEEEKSGGGDISFRRRKCDDPPGRHKCHRTAESVRADENLRTGSGRRLYRGSAARISGQLLLLLPDALRIRESGEWSDIRDGASGECAWSESDSGGTGYDHDRGVHGDFTKCVCGDGRIPERGFLYAWRDSYGSIG